MHIHSAQFNLDMQTNALYAAARAEAKLAAERTKKKLINFASVLAGEVDDEADCVMQLTRDGTPRDQSSQHDSHGESSKESQSPQTDPETDPFSGWA